MDNIGDALNKWFKEMAEHAKERATAALNEAWTEVKPEIAEAFEKIYEQAIGRWYDAYTPIFYSRNHSLYDLMETKEDGSDGAFTFLFDGANMTHDRHGDSLFEKVFIQGWHGGAYAGDTIRYRTPYGGYWHWGRRAVRTLPAYYIFEKEKEHKVAYYSQRIADVAMQKAAGE